MCSTAGAGEASVARAHMDCAVTDGQRATDKAIWTDIIEHFGSKTDVENAIQSAHLVESNLVRTNPVDSTFSIRQLAKCFLRNIFGPGVSALAASQLPYIGK